jgi:hypothetical protein
MVYQVSVGALFKNEEDSIEEWIKHYLYHGVEHFYLIDDSSTDKSVEIIQPYIDSGFITLFKTSWEYYLGRQRAMYNTFILPKLREKETKWLIIVDIDEYLWSTVSTNLMDILKETSHLGQIQVHDTLYGDGGLITQPDSVVQGFLKRTNDCPTVEENGGTGNSKYIVNSDFEFSSLNIHHADFTDKKYSCGTYFILVSSEWLILNHYKTQSLEFWKKVKCTRGDGDNYLVRTIDDFYRINEKCNQVEDTRLAEQNKNISEFI